MGHYNCFPIILLALAVNKRALTKTRESEMAGSRVVETIKGNTFHHTHFQDKQFQPREGGLNTAVPFELVMQSPDPEPTFILESLPLPKRRLTASGR